MTWMDTAHQNRWILPTKTAEIASVQYISSPPRAPLPYPCPCHTHMAHAPLPYPCPCHTHMAHATCPPTIPGPLPYPHSTCPPTIPVPLPYPWHMPHAPLPYPGPCLACLPGQRRRRVSCLCRCPGPGGFDRHQCPPARTHTRPQHDSDDESRMRPDMQHGCMHCKHCRHSLRAACMVLG